MPLHICFADYHSEMKFEQLLKIICKRYFVSFFLYYFVFFCFFFLLFKSLFLSVSHSPLACLFVEAMVLAAAQTDTNRAAMKLIMFPKTYFWGLIPIAGSWVFILLLFSHCTARSKTLMMLSEAAVGVRIFKRWEKKKPEMCVTLGAATTFGC